MALTHRQLCTSCQVRISTWAAMMANYNREGVILTLRVLQFRDCVQSGVYPWLVLPLAA